MTQGSKGRKGIAEMGAAEGVTLQYMWYTEH